MERQRAEAIFDVFSQMKPGVYRVTQDFPNPLFSACRTGFEGVDTIHEGYRFELRHTPSPWGDIHTNYSLHGRRGVIVSGTRDMYINFEEQASRGEEAVLRLLERVSLFAKWQDSDLPQLAGEGAFQILPPSSVALLGLLIQNGVSTKEQAADAIKSLAKMNSKELRALAAEYGYPIA